jgi:DNA-binding NarL/FixJ family response regulator
VGACSTYAHIPGWSIRAEPLEREKEEFLKDQSVQLSPREQQIIELLLLGCGNAEIARELKIAGRTVKAHFNRLFLRFGLNDGIKRVKLATMMYRRQISQPIDIMEEPRQSEPEGIAMPLCK